MELEQEQEPETLAEMDFISFRVSHPSIGHPLDDLDMTAYYIINIKNYLKKYGYNILYSSLGFHTNSATPHFHYHVVHSRKKVPKVVLQHWKYVYKNNKLPVMYHTDGKYKDYPCLYSHKLEYQKQINVSIQHTLKENLTVQELEQFLQYPLKEKKIVGIECKNIDIERLATQAHTLYLDALKKQKQKEEKLEKSNSLFKVLEKKINEETLETYEDNLRFCLEFARTHETPIHYRKVAEFVQTICYRNKIITIDQIVQKYYL